ncbi:non-ribosomal peptide synthetase [Chitinophaga qingshengii]|uniref:Amino acid adenylation domain-containing protein n=1 Tax=Chitinophaga qingshengii TaxID=1569794 RepID=A0ABR7TFZ8_9BACT|nr:non-ribosomal peptide synthetase [Chitinophaga qingshengii]MBC9929269.1 amino acid adenylation domain-containing protein [Chitinophaga qingshengii]
MIPTSPVQDQLNIVANQHVAERNFWLQLLSGNPEKAVFPYDRDNRLQPATPDKLIFELPATLADKLNAHAKGNEKALHMILMTGVMALLSRYTSLSDVVIGTPVYDQQAPVHSLINTMLLLRRNFSEETFRSALTAVKSALTDALKHQNYPVKILPSLLGMEYDNEHEFPLFDVSVSLKGLHDPEYAEQIPHRLHFIFDPTEDVWQITVVFDKTAYLPDTISSIVRHLCFFLNEATTYPNKPLFEIDMLSSEDMGVLLHCLDNTAVKYPDNAVIHGFFEQQVQLAAGNTAISCGDRQMSYGELDEQSNKVANWLRSNGAGNGSLVALLIDRSPEMIAAIIGVLKCGATYLPIDPDLPQQRIDFLLNDSNAGWIVADQVYVAKISCGVKVLLTDDEAWKTASVQPLEVKVHPDDAAYVIYTSGTTGLPKGVMVSHRSVVRLLFNDASLFDFSDTDVWTLFHDYNFDFSVWEIFGALLYGGRLVIVTKEVARDPRQFLGLVMKQGITVLNQTPSAFYAFGEAALTALPAAAELPLKTVVFGGEALAPSRLKNWINRYPAVDLINMYGITETTVHVTYKKITVEDIANGTSNIGKPLPTLELLVLDSRGQLVPAGVKGELYVGGEGLAIGYLNQPLLTAERFVVHPFKSGQRLYKTGDCVRMKTDGDLEYFHRLDHQVKLRGYRIEPGEIENQLLRLPGIKGVVVLAETDEEGHQSLCAYLSGATGISGEEMRKFAASCLPPYMVPAAFVSLEKFPLTNNNKIDHTALRKYRHTATKIVVPAKDEVEEKMLRIWQRLLKQEDISTTDSYFHIGGDSIRAIRLIGEINKAFGRNLKIADIYRYDTIREITNLVRLEALSGTIAAKGEAMQQLDEFRQVIINNKALPAYGAIEDIFPMSDIQKGMTYYSNLNTAEAVYHEQVVLEIRYEDFSCEHFEQALAMLVQKHIIFRSAFWMDYYAHIVYDRAEYQIPLHDISHHKPEEQRELLEEALVAGRNQPFELEKPPLWRMSLYRCSDNFHVLLFELHHAILDGWSQASFLTELNNTYLRLFTDKDYKLSPLSVSYRDFIIQEMISKKDPQVAAFWQQELKDYKRVAIGSSHNRSALGFKRKISHLGHEMYQKLEASARRLDTNVKHICFAAYAYTINMLSSDADIVVGLTTNTRPPDMDAAQLVACFLNTVPVRLQTDEAPSWAGFVQLVDRKLKALKYVDGVSLSEIMNICGEQTTEKNPFFDTKFNYIDFHVVKGMEEAPVDNTATSLGISHFINENTLLDFHINNTWQNLILTIVYASGCVTDEMAERLNAYFIKLLELFISQPDGDVCKSEVLSSKELQQVTIDFNDTDKYFERELQILDTYRHRVAACPDEVGWIYEDEVFTHAFIDSCTDRIAAAIIARKKGDKQVVPVMLERSPGMLMALLGILKSGNAWLPIDPAWPSARIGYILEDAGASLMIAETTFTHAPEGCGVLDLETAMLASPGALPLIADEDLAYVIYTSGSTGMPKGAMIEHGALRNRLRWMRDAYEIGNRDIILQKTPYIFDVSVWELLLWTISGATLCIAPEGLEKDPDGMIEAINIHQITILHFVPSVLTYFMNALEEQACSIPSLRRIFSSGEALEKHQVSRMMTLKEYCSAELSNLYGPTEATIDVTWFDVTNDNYPRIPIGYPIDNIRIYILDNSLQIQPAGVPGELCIAGIGLARGYLNRPELTAERFVTHPLLQRKIYRTGDYARWDENGALIYMGRKDDQVKVGGVRIELAEIEAAFRKLPYIREIVVLVAKEASGEQSLRAYYISEFPIAPVRVRKDVGRYLPAAMVPSFLLAVGMIPFTQNGKADKKALLSLEVEEVITVAYCAPETEIEKKVAEIWEEFTGKDNLGLDDELFTTGADSIKALQIVSKMKRQIDKRLHIKDVFTYPTVRQLAAYISKLTAE